MANGTGETALALVALGGGAWLLKNVLMKEPAPQQQIQYPPAAAQVPTPYATTTTTTSPAPVISHAFNISEIEPQISTSGGTERLATSDNCPILRVPDNQYASNWGISFAILDLKPRGVREPHWHVNANELLYCVSGRAVMTIFLGSPQVVHESLIVNPGEIVFIPRGYTHDIENIDPVDATFLESWDNQRVETAGLSSVIGVSPIDVLNATFSMPENSTFWTGMNKDGKDIGIGLKPSDSPQPTLAAQARTPPSTIQQQRPPPPAIPPQQLQHTTTYPTFPGAGMKLVEPPPTTGAIKRSFVAAAATPLMVPQRAGTTIYHSLPQPSPLIPTRHQVTPTSRFKLDLERTQPSISTPGGNDIQGSVQRLPILKGLACFSITLRPKGVREPHWHPNAGELHFILQGESGYQVNDPGASQPDTGTLGAGSFFYAPPGYLHSFWNMSQSGGNLHVMAFFTNENPQDVGLSGALSAYSNGVLGAMFNTQASKFNNMPRFRSDSIIVGGSKV